MVIIVQGIHDLIKSCERLTHLSLTGVDVFYSRKDFTQFCRPPPEGMPATPPSCTTLNVDLNRIQ